MGWCNRSDRREPSSFTASRAAAGIVPRSGPVATAATATIQHMAHGTNNNNSSNGQRRGQRRRRLGLVYWLPTCVLGITKIKRPANNQRCLPRAIHIINIHHCDATISCPPPSVGCCHPGSHFDAAAHFYTPLQHAASPLPLRPPFVTPPAQPHRPAYVPTRHLPAIRCCTVELLAELCRCWRAAAYFVLSGGCCEWAGCEH